ncbi:hypothetical protein [Mycoplana ramosa]|uniref:Uncharacterized protein n=1 Tax=Mycoplana ramosa TaxID=40837 RepID=A0ABW3YWS3_MYCRA
MTRVRGQSLGKRIDASSLTAIASVGDDIAPQTAPGKVFTIGFIFAGIWFFVRR